MDHVYLDEFDRLVCAGQYLLTVLQTPDGTIVTFTPKEIEIHKALIVRQRLELVGLWGLVNGSPEFVELHPLSLSALTAIGAHYRLHVEQKRAEAMNAARVQPASEPAYAWDLKKYLH